MTMDRSWYQLAWFAIVSIIIAYVVYIVASSVVNAQAAGLNEPVLVRDELRPGEHELSGMVMVPSPCDELAVQTRQISTTQYSLDFTTWREPSIACSDDRTPRDFQTSLFAPAAGVYFVATLDGQALPIGVVPLVYSEQ